MNCENDNPNIQYEQTTNSQNPKTKHISLTHLVEMALVDVCNT
jgi:hypothetical protein